MVVANNVWQLIIMAKVYLSDVFKIYKDFEPSKLKIWEIVRTYHPIEFAKLLYLLENVSRNYKRDAICLNDSEIDYNFSKQHHVPYLLSASENPCIRLERGIEVPSILWNTTTTTTTNNTNSTSPSLCFCCNEKYDISHLLEYIQSPKYMASKYYTQEFKKCRLFQILNHNIGTTYYASLLNSIQNLLFNENFQTDRNEIDSNNNNNNSSIVIKFRQFYQNIIYKQSVDSDVRNFRNIIIPKPVRIFDRDLMSSCSSSSSNNSSSGNSDKQFMVQPLYQGLHVIVYTSPNETKCYSRFGCLQQNLAYSLKSDSDICTFEAIILPIDNLKHARSWRYWPFKSGFMFYVVDVFRYNQTILTSMPFRERAKYIPLVVKNNSSLFAAQLSKSWETLERDYIANRDIYDPIVGVVLRDPEQIISPNSDTGGDRTNSIDININNGNKNFKAIENKAFYFNILYSFDLLQSKVVDLQLNLPPETVQCLHLNYEMADFKTVCVAYGHCDQFIYLCTYNRNLHQFVHAAKLTRSPNEYNKLTYKSEKIYVLNNETLPRGILYLRVYYDMSKNIIGYEHKCTDDRFKVAYTNPLFYDGSDNVEDCDVDTD